MSFIDRCSLNEGHPGKVTMLDFLRVVRFAQDIRLLYHLFFIKKHEMPLRLLSFLNNEETGVSYDKIELAQRSRDLNKHSIDMFCPGYFSLNTTMIDMFYVANT